MSSSDVVWFANSPLPPVRVGKLDQTGNFALVFRNEADRADQQKNCQIQVTENCLKGLRASCAITASRQSRPSSILSFFGLAKGQSWEDKDRQEDQLTSACVAQGASQCATHAEDFCKVVFSGPVAADIK
ncbi:hypothetical protein Ndes2526B_g01651 [Nannochloris sp. 'desiccata']